MSGGPSAVQLAFPPETPQVSGTNLIRVADRPPPWAGLSASQFELPPEPNMLSGAGADRPRHRGGRSALVQSALNLDLFQIFSKRC